ncbi:MAG: hypothetical protein HLUCCA11_00175 [Phormidesmis priestleyi Ana]|uniref:Uncharacterized protein n=1 Tax=Phormidesmis priestleyi Ana TaxID=1666911 RepID=A0A0P7ZV12_9CYAN|nr:MAG: hypothetical protein HLUCCA11_00175 [Phormidesmis priestleyi Ana]
MATKKENRENKDVDLKTSGKQTTLNPETRTTGQGSNTDTRDGAEPEAPGNDGNVPGSPNQGTESR